jgi:UDP-glucose 4-epimerase
MKILITGVGGLIGSNFADYLQKSGYDVLGIDNFFGGYEDFIPPNVPWRKIELTDDKAVADIFTLYKPAVVYHFAAYAAEGLSPFIRKFNYENNVIASVNVINECIKSDAKLVFTSSMAVYGKQDPPFIESMTPAPVDPYGIAKYTVEQDIKQANDQFGLKYNIVRPHNVLGKNQNIWDKYRNVIGIWIRRALKGEPILVYGDGEQKRAFSDINCYLEPLEKLCNGFDNETFNIGADREYTLNEAAEIVQAVAAKYNIAVEIKHVEGRHEVKNAYCDHKKAKQLLNFKDTTDLKQLIQDVFEWAMTQLDRQVKHMNYEVDKNIYSFWK